MPEAGRWKGRSPAKDVIRDEVWGRLEAARVRPDQFATIPFLSRLRDRITAGSIT